MKARCKILIIAGSDSSGGAGIQADIKTISSLGSYAMTAITAITSQNTTGVKSIVSIHPKEISNQIEFTSKDIKPDAIKIGMLHSSKVISAVIKSLKHSKNLFAAKDNKKNSKKMSNDVSINNHLKKFRSNLIAFKFLADSRNASLHLITTPYEPKNWIGESNGIKENKESTINLFNNEIRDITKNFNISYKRVNDNS